MRERALGRGVESQVVSCLFNVPSTSFHPFLLLCDTAEQCCSTLEQPVFPSWGQSMSRSVKPGDLNPSVDLLGRDLPT